jgi:type IV secretion system protein VirB6
MASYITEALTLVDAAVATYAEDVFTNFAGPLTTSIRLAGVVTLALLGANAIVAWVPIKTTDLLKWGMRYTIVLMIATSWTQFLPFYDIITNVPGSIGAELLDQSGVSSLNEAMDNMVTGIFDSSETAADQSGFVLSALISFGLMIVGALMATVAIVVTGIGKIGLAMSVSLAPVFIACLLFKATSDLFSAWCKFTLGFAMIPLVLAGVMGVILGIGETFLVSVGSASTLAEVASFLIVAMAAIFLMSQVPTMVNGLAGTVVATASGTREARQMAGTGVRGLKGGAAAGSAMAPSAKVMGTALRAGAQAEPGGRGTAIGQELINAHVAHKKAITNNRERLASLGRRSTLGSDFTSGQAGMEQHARRRWNELKSEKT